jgi:hypothetical protein
MRIVSVPFTVDLVQHAEELASLRHRHVCDCQSETEQRPGKHTH